MALKSASRASASRALDDALGSRVICFISVSLCESELLATEHPSIRRVRSEILTYATMCMLVRADVGIVVVGSCVALGADVALRGDQLCAEEMAKRDVLQ